MAFLGIVIRLGCNLLVGRSKNVMLFLHRIIRYVFLHLYLIDIGAYLWGKLNLWTAPTATAQKLKKMDILTTANKIINVMIASANGLTYATKPLKHLCFDGFVVKNLFCFNSFWLLLLQWQWTFRLHLLLLLGRACIGCRCLPSPTKGVAIKIGEYVPSKIPMSKAKEKPRNTSAR